MVCPASSPAERQGWRPQLKFDQLDEQARQTAFTIASVVSEDALEKLRTALVQDVSSGGTLAEFAQKVDDVLGASALSPSHIENVYRTSTAVAVAADRRPGIAPGPDSCGTISLQQSEWCPQPAGEGKRGGRIPPHLSPYPAQVSASFSFFLSRGRAAAQLEQYGVIGDRKLGRNRPVA
jgi:hypothetical protein